MSKRVAVYARVSTTRQAENDISISDQIAQARRYCASRKWTVVREFIDPGASARDEKRPELQKMMDAACVDPSPYDVILVHSQSRFFRDTAGYVAHKHKLQKHAVSLVSMTQDFGQGPSADFAETIIAASDALHSAETAKHVSRTMLENARQGFWNGSRPPLGYRTIEVERRGQRIKKHLEIEEREAATVRKIFDLFLNGDGTKGPMGIKDIASWLNHRKIHNRSGRQFYTSAVHSILRTDAYSGTHFYNRHDSRTRKLRPKNEWVPLGVPQLISRQQFERVQAMLRSRRPEMTPPRVTNSEVLLTGIVRCESCGSPMMVRTGKSRTYRYYACASNRLKGPAACESPIAIRESQLDTMVIEALADRLLTPERLPRLLHAAHAHRRATSAENIQRRSALRKQRAETEKQILHLYDALSEGIVSDTAMFRTKLSNLEGKRDEAIRLLSMLENDVPPLRRALSNGQANALAQVFKRRLLDAPRQLRRRYVQGLVSSVRVDRERAIISGSTEVLASAVSAGNLPDRVSSSVREWRTRQDSNL